MYSVFIGYIIELDQRTAVAKIETGNNNVRLSEEMFDFWQLIEFFMESVPDDDVALWDELKQKGVLACAETIDEFYECIRNLYPIRQGVIYKSDENAHIVLGDVPIEIVKLQSYIWQGADGKRSLSDIFIKASNNERLNEVEPVRDFVENVVGLVRAGALFLKN